MDYKYKYDKYRDLSNKMDNNLIYITGKGAVGKSTVAKMYREKGYELVSLDKLIKEKILPHFEKLLSEDEIFAIYNLGDNGKIINKAKEMFKKMVKNIIAGRKGKMVVEGSIADNKLIKYLFGNIFTLLYVMPSSSIDYKNKIMARFNENSCNYGRLRFLKSVDTNGNALKDFLKN